MNELAGDALQVTSDPPGGAIRHRPAPQRCRETKYGAHGIDFWTLAPPLAGDARSTVFIDASACRNFVTVQIPRKRFDSLAIAVLPQWRPFPSGAP
jgi:hypothetical protein